MGHASTILLFLSLVILGICQQQAIGADHKKSNYNVTLDFDELPTNPSGVGFHPSDPKEGPVHYKSVYLQSFTLLNASKADLSKADTTCSRSWPNSIFASRREGFAWPRISLHDLSNAKSKPDETALKSKHTFSLVSLWLKPTGNVTGAPDATLSTITLTMLRLHPSPISGPVPPEAGYPGIVRGSPLPVAVGHVSMLNIFFGPGVHGGIQLNIRSLFGTQVGSGIDVIEVTSQVLRRDEKSGQWQAEDWEVCMDNIVLEIVEGGKNEVGDLGPRVVGVKADGSEVEENDMEWEVMRQMGGF